MFMKVCNLCNRVFRLSSILSQSTWRKQAFDTLKKVGSWNRNPLVPTNPFSRKKSRSETHFGGFTPPPHTHTHIYTHSGKTASVGACVKGPQFLIKPSLFHTYIIQFVIMMIMIYLMLTSYVFFLYVINLFLHFSCNLGILKVGVFVLKNLCIMLHKLVTKPEK